MPRSSEASGSSSRNAGLDLVRGGPWFVNLLALLLVLAPLAYIGYRATFSYLGGVDDEGYFLISLREWVDGHSLYDDVYSQYGPGLFVLIGAPLGFLDLLDTDGARLVNLVIWLSTSLLTGATLLRIGRNLPLAAAGTGLTFFVLTSGLGQALHPGGALCLLLIGIVATAAFLLPERPAIAMFTIGTLVAAAGLMKANVGGLALIAIGFSLVLTSDRLGRDRVIRFVACAALVLVPFTLLSSDLSQDLGLRYAAVVGIAALALGLVATALPPSRVKLERHWVSLAGGVGVMLVFVIGVAMVTGSSPSGLVRGVILDPLELTDLVSLPVKLDSGGPLWGAAWLAGAGLFRWRLARREEWSAHENALAGAVGTAAGFAVWISLAELPNTPGLSGTTTGIWVGAPIAWMVAVRPPGAADRDNSFLRTLVPALAVMQLLHAYPVPGSQIGWSEFLLVLVGGICIADGIERLSMGGAALTSDVRRWRTAATVAVIGFGAWFALGPLRDFHRDASSSYDGGEVLGLAGASHVRLPAGEAGQFRDVAADLESRCDNFISLPGLTSFYGWTETEPPTSLNAGAWPWLLDADHQQRVVEQVDGIDRLCVLRSPFIYTTWSQLLGPAPDRPLLRYITENFEVVRVYPFPYQALELLQRRQL